MNRGVLVTGAARGIGRAVAQAFAASGDRVAVHYGTRHDRAQDTLESLPGPGHGLVRADLRDPAGAADLAARAADLLDGVDVLVNNAAVSIAHPIAETPYKEWRAAWRETMDVNVFGAADVSYLVARHMIDRLSDAVLAQSPFGRVATPEEVASAVRYLASPEAVWSSGTVLDVNGASHLR